MKPYKIYHYTNTDGALEITITHKVVEHKLYIDLMTGIDERTVTLRYPFTNSILIRFEKEIDQLDALLRHSGLKDKAESKYHLSNILYYIIEFKLKYDQLLKESKIEERVTEQVEFLKRIQHLTPSQVQQIKMTFLIKGIPFTFEDNPMLAEMVVNKLSGVLKNNIKHLYPEHWQIYKGEAKSLTRKSTPSVLRNKAVAVIAKLLLHYLNTETILYSHKNVQQNHSAINSQKGDFIIKLLTLFDVYRPRNVARSSTSKKLNEYDKLRKLIARSK